MMGILTVSTSKGKTLRSLIDATKSGTGTLVSDGDGGVVLGGGGESSVQSLAAQVWKPWPLSPGQAAANISANTTYSMVIEAPSKCYGLRVIFVNKLRSTVNVLGAKIHTITGVANSTKTSGVAVTVNGAASFDLPAASSLNNYPAGYLLSDPVFFDPVSRLDGNPRTLVMLKVAYGATAGAVATLNQNNNIMCPIMAWGSAAGNALSTAFPASQPATLELAGFVFYCDVPKVSVSIFGDSLAAGTSSDATDVGGGLQIACNDLGLPLANWALGGQSGAPRDATVKQIIELGAHRSSIVIVEGWTQNNGSTPSASWGLGLASYDRILAAGGNPVFMGPTPINTNPSWPLQLKAILDSSGLPYIDTFTPFANVDGTWKDGYSSDGVHFDGAGHVALAEVYKGYIEQYL